MNQQNLNEWMFSVQLIFLESYESTRITPQKGQAENSWNGSIKLSRSISPLQYPSTVCVLIIALGEQVDFFPWGNRIITEQMIHLCKYTYWRFCTTYDLRNKRVQNEHESCLNAQLCGSDHITQEHRPHLPKITVGPYQVPVIFYALENCIFFPLPQIQCLDSDPRITRATPHFFFFFFSQP